MVVYLKDEIGLPLTDKFVDTINRLEPDDELIVYLNSDGGEVADQEVIISLINLYEDRVHLIACGNIYSAGFEIFFRSRCKRSLCRGVSGMVHFSWASLEVDQTGKPKASYEKFVFNGMKEDKKKYLEYLEELGLTKTELRKVKRGDEVYFGENRLHDFLNKQNGQKEAE